MPICQSKTLSMRMSFFLQLEQQQVQHPVVGEGVLVHWCEPGSRANSSKWARLPFQVSLFYPFTSLDCNSQLCFCRDCTNVSTFFSKHGVETLSPGDLFSHVSGLETSPGKGTHSTWEKKSSQRNNVWTWPVTSQAQRQKFWARSDDIRRTQQLKAQLALNRGKEMILRWVRSFSSIALKQT